MSLVRLDIKGISYSQTQNGAYALILSEVDGDRKLPIVIGAFEAQSIAIALEKEIKPPRPLTHDLFKNFADVDAYDIEVDETDIDRFCDVVAALEPTFGGINLEDIKAPECFEIERRLRERMKIPVFHDDQHGTAIVAAAAVINGLRVVEKDIADIRLVVSGAGAAAMACTNQLIDVGVQRENILMLDSRGRKTTSPSSPHRSWGQTHPAYKKE